MTTAQLARLVDWLKKRRLHTRGDFKTTQVHSQLKRLTISHRVEGFSPLPDKLIISDYIKLVNTYFKKIKSKEISKNDNNKN